MTMYIIITFSIKLFFLEIDHGYLYSFGSYCNILTFESQFSNNVHYFQVSKIIINIGN